MEFYRFFDSLVSNSPFSLYSSRGDLLEPEQAAVCCNYVLHHAPHLLEPLLNRCPNPNLFADICGDDFTLLSEILSHDKAAALDTLLRHGLDPNGLNCDDPNYWTPVEAAFLYDAPCCLARLLAEPGISVSVTNHIEEHWDSSSDSCRYLLSAYLDANRNFLEAFSNTELDDDLWDNLEDEPDED